LQEFIKKVNVTENCKKILYILTKADLGGAQKYLIEITKYLPDNYKPYYLMASEGYFSNELVKLGISREQIFFVPMTNSITNLPLHFKSNAETIKIIKKIKPDLIHCNSMTGGVVGRICGFLTGTPVIFTAHGWTFAADYSKPLIIFYKILETLLGFLTKKIICVSEFDRQIGIKTMPFFKNKMITVHNGISDIQKEFIKKEFYGNDLKIIMISRFAYPKDPYTLISAVSELNKNGCRVKLDLFGYGEDTEKVKSFINDCGDENIAYKGELYEVAPVLKDYDVYALISKKEGLPLGIIEGMRSALPVLASNVGGNAECINGNGYLVKKEDVSDCKEQIKKILNSKNELKILGAKSRTLYECKFCAERMATETIAIYENVSK